MDEQLINSTLFQAYKQAPPYIQKYIASGKFEAFMGMITTHFGLHADVAEKVSNEILMTIIGLTPPAELAANLKNEAGVADGLIPPILEELNTDVFIPLRESLEKNTEESFAAPVAPVPVPAQEEKWIQVTPAIEPAPAAAPTPIVETIPQQAPAPVFQQPAPMAAPVYQTPVQQVPQPMPTPTPIPVPTTVQATVPNPTPAVAPEYHDMVSMMRTMSKDIEALKGGVAPSMTPWKTVSVQVPATPAPAAPTHAPSYISPTVQTITPAPAAPRATAPSPIVHERVVTPPINRGAGDPYREPVE